jgi:hypothetical protein
MIDLGGRLVLLPLAESLSIAILRIRLLVTIARNTPRLPKRYRVIVEPRKSLTGLTPVNYMQSTPRSTKLQSNGN